MSIKLMYITNNPYIAKIADNNGVDWIFVDLEVNGKDDRQGHLDTVISRHQISDIKPIKDVLSKSELLVRVNPIYNDSPKEIEEVINEGADIVMLPYFKSSQEVSKFIEYVNNKAKVCLLLETIDGVAALDDILKLSGIDYIHIGLNDLHLELDKTFMFELLQDGTVEKIISKIKKANIPYGFGGIANLGNGDLPSEKIITEHIRLGSTMAILSRTFCPHDNDVNKAQSIFNQEIGKIRNYISQENLKSTEYFDNNKEEIDSLVTYVVNKIRK